MAVPLFQRSDPAATAGEGARLDVDALLALRHLARERPARHLGATTRPGGLVGRRKGPGLEIVDVRPFVAGDDIRHIDRNATARTGTRHVRTFSEERERVTLLLADFSTDMLWGTRRALRSVAAAEALTVEGWRTLEAGGKAALLVHAAGEVAYVAPQGRERGMARLLGRLARAHDEALAASRRAGVPAEDGSALLLEAALKAGPRGATVLLASGLDAAGPRFDRAALALMQRARLACLVVLDRFEIEPPAGLYPFLAPNGARGIGSVEAGVPPPDPRIARLERLGLPFAVVDAGLAPEAAGRGVEERVDERFARAR